MSRFKIVEDLSNKKYNCAQAISCAYADLTKISHEDFFKLTECLGGGIGRMQGTCGGLMAVFLIAGYINSDGDFENNKSRLENYAKIKELNYKFVEKLGSSQCIELLRGEAPKGGMCNHILKVCSEILEEFFIKQGVKF